VYTCYCCVVDLEGFLGVTGSSVGRPVHTCKNCSTQLSRFLDAVWIISDCARKTVEEVLINPGGYFGDLIRN